MIRSFAEAIRKKHMTVKLLAESRKQLSGRQNTTGSELDESADDDTSLLVRSVDETTSTEDVADRDTATVQTEVEANEHVPYRPAEIGTPFNPPE